MSNLSGRWSRGPPASPPRSADRATRGPTPARRCGRGGLRGPHHAGASHPAPRGRCPTGTHGAADGPPEDMPSEGDFRGSHRGREVAPTRRPA